MNISVKKFSKKSLSLLIALIMVFSALPFTPPISADAATVSKSVKVANYGVLSSGGRINTNNKYFEIVNDGGNGNFSIGCVRFNISNLEAYKHEVTSAMYNISHYANNSRTNNMYIGFYYPTKNLDTYTLNKGTAPNNDTFYSNIFNDTTNLNHTHFSAAKSYFGLQEITTVSSSSNNSTNPVSIDIAPLLNYALKNNTTATLMIMLTDYDHDDSKWSDRLVYFTDADFNVTANEKTFSTEVTSSNNANSTTNRVKIGDAIYTYESSSAYYNYGKTISIESDWNTPISTTDTISSVECMDDGSALTVSNGLLSGNLKADKFAVNTDTNVNATLKFTFRDGKIEYHRVAVKSYPVENHVCVFAERSGESEAGYTMFLRGSTGSGGSGVWNYNKSYYTSGNTAHGSPDRNYVVSDKKAYVYAYSYSDWRQDKNAVPSVSLATYYIDKSCSGTSWSSLGNSELWNSSTNNYSISIDLVRTKFQYPLGNDWALELNNSPVQGKLTLPQNPQKSDVNGTTYTSTFTHNSSVTTSNRYSSCNDTTCNVRLAVHAHDKGWALMKTNMVVNLFDKSVARNLYIDYLNENKISDSYTASSFAAYQNALLDMEAYLSNYEDTTKATTSQSVYTNLVNAHNGLTARGDISALEAAYAKYKDIATNSNKYTTDSYNAWNSEIAFDSTLIAFEQLTSEQKRDLTASDVETYKAPFDKLNYELLVLRADSSVFSILDNQVTIAREKLSLDNVNYTENSKIALQNALNNATYKDYTDSQKANTPKSVETDIYNQYLDIFNAISALAYDKTSQQDVYNAYVEAKNSKNESCYTSSDWQNYTLRIKDLATWLADDTNGNITEFNSLVTTLDNTIATIEANHRTNHYKYVYDRVNNQHTYACENNCSVDAPVTSDCTYNYFTANHISTAECSACKGGYSLDYTAFDAKVEDLNTKLQETKKYSNTASCKKKLDEITALSTAFTKVTTQDELDALIKRLTDEVENALQIAVYSITLNFFDENGKPLGIGENGSTSKIYSGLTYGALQNVQVPLRYNNIDYTVVKWTRHENGDAITGFNSSSIDVIVKGKCEYNVYLKRITAENINQDTTVVVTLKNKSNKTVDIGYVTKSTEAQSVTVDVGTRTIRIGDVILTAPAYSFYNLIGFDINDTTITESGSVVFDSNTVIIPIYTASKSFTITRGTGDYNNFTINGKDEASYTAKWNEEVVLKAPEKVLWCTGNRVNPIVLSYSQEYVFYANKAMSIFAINPVLSFDVSTDPTASVGYFDYDVELNRVTVVNNFFAVDLSKVEKAGVVLSTKTGNRDTLMTQTNGRFEGTPDKFTKNGNQLRVSVSRTAHTSFTMYALAYVVVNGKTYYSSEVSQYTYTATTA